MRARWLGIALLLTGCSLLVNPRADNEYDLVDGGTQAPDGGERDGSAERDGGVDAGPAIPAAPVLRFPWNGFMTGSVHTGALPTERNALRPRFVWEPSEGAERYEVQLTAACEAQTREACTFDGAIEGVSSESEWRPEEALPVSLTAPVGRRYIWRARACNVAGCSGWTPVRYLDVGRQPSDFNGDGYADVLVGAPGEFEGRGRAYVFDGPDLSSSHDESNPSGGETGGFFGNLVASAGDLTGDGFADALIWAENDDVDAVENAGRVYRCPRSPFGIDCFGGGIVSPTPERLGGYGWALAGACDIDGNGIADFVIGAPKETVVGADDSGRVYVYLSQTTGTVPDPIVLESPAGEPSGLFGASVDCASDLDGDGFVDLVVGAPGESAGAVAASGRVYVYRGGATDLSAPAETLLSSTGNVEGFFGHTVATADLFGDDMADLIVGAPGEVIGGFAFAGRVHVQQRTAAGISMLSLERSMPQGVAFGVRLEAVSATDGGGLVLVGSLAEGGEATAFRALPGGTFAASETLDRPPVVAGSSYVLRTATVGDIHGDGSAWFAVGAPLDTDTGTNLQAGSVWLFEWDRATTPALRERIESPASESNGTFGVVGDTSTNTFET